jgi:hypothetical protein
MLSGVILQPQPITDLDYRLSGNLWGTTTVNHKDPDYLTKYYRYIMFIRTAFCEISQEVAC